MDYAKTVNQSTCSGHLHSQGGYKFHQDIRGRQICSLQVATGVEDDAYAFAYGKRNPKKPQLGCGFRQDGIRSEERRVGKECRCRWAAKH